MTLLIYLPCKDGCILISDRLEVDLDGAKYEVDKIFVPQTCDFAIAGAGSSSIIETYFARMERSSEVDGNNVDQKFEEIMKEILPSEEKFTTERTKEVEFIIIASKGDTVEPFYAWVTAGEPYIRKIGKEVPYYTEEGGILLKYLLSKNRIYQKLTLFEAIPYAVAIMKEVSDNFLFVGGLEEYGFGIIAFSNECNVFINRNFRQKAASIDLSFQIKKDFDPTEFEVTKIQTRRE